MRLDADYLVVGAGLTGATIARLLHDAGKDVIVVEARDHCGGNVADAMHLSGIRYNLHGPHYFRTSSARIRRFAERFASFYPFAAVVMSQVGKELFPWPLQRSTSLRLGLDPNPIPAATAKSANFEAAMLSQVPRRLYDMFIGGYTAKQWGMAPSELDAGLARRVEIRHDGDTRLSKARFQALPGQGYTIWVEAMLAGIEVRLSTDFHAARDTMRWKRKLIYTGPIDRYFNYAFGSLPYRTQERNSQFLPDVRQVLPCGQVNLPSVDDGPHIRTIEWKHMMAPGTAPEAGTLLTFEVPRDAEGWQDAEYPLPTAAGRNMFHRYVRLARELPDVLICGRLGEYRYLDMDQAIGRAMMLAGRLLREAA